MDVRRVLRQAGAEDTDIPQYWTPAIMAAMAKWMQTTDAGFLFASQLLMMNVESGRDEKSYHVYDPETGTEKSVESNRVWFFEGACVDSVSTPISSIRIAEKHREICDGCSTVSHCVKELLDPFTGTVKNMCNNCITYHEHPRVKDHGGYSICEKCTKTICTHHPAKIKLLPGGRGFY